MRSTALTLLFAASLVGAGCSGGDTPSAVDSGVADVGESDGSTPEDTGSPVDTGTPVDTGGTDAGMPEDNGGTDAGTPVDTGTDAGAPTDVGGDSGTPGDSGMPGDGGMTGRPHAGSSLVSAGSLMRSARFQMISTLGGRSVQQTNLQSPNYRLRGGLVGTIGAR